MDPQSISQAKGETASKRAKARWVRRVLATSMTAIMFASAIASDASAHGFGFGHFGGYHPMAQSAWHPHYGSYARAPGRPPSDGPRQPGRGRWPIWGWHPIRHPYPYPVYGGTDDAPDVPSSASPMSSQNLVHMPPHHQHFVATVHRTTSGVPAVGEHRFVPDEVLFTVKGSAEVAQRIARNHHLTPLSAHPMALLGITLHRYRIGAHRSVPEVIRELETEQQIAFVQPNYIFKLEGDETGGQSLIAAQYALAKMHLIEAHRVTEGERSLVAVIDSGIDASHPDLAGVVADGVDLVADQVKSDAHGTAVASIIGAHGALTGAAPQAKLLAIRAFSESKSAPGAEGTSAHVLEGLNWAFEHKARAVNMSFAGPQDPMLAEALAAAHRNGMILIAAAGNDGASAPPAYPAADPNVIAVTATDRDDKLFNGANRGDYICLAAPGSDIIVAAPAHSYQFSSGTSMAAAYVSGLVALLLSERPDLSADAARKILTETADDLGAHGRDPAFGAGLSDAEKAVTVVKAMHGRQLAKSDELKSDTVSPLSK